MRQPAPTPPAAPPTVKEISGRVTDTDGDPVPNASVVLIDSQGRSYETTTNGSGSFKFLGTADKPIAPGQIDLGASLDDKIQKKTVTAAANQALTNQQIALALGQRHAVGHAGGRAHRGRPHRRGRADRGRYRRAAQQAASTDTGSGGGMGSLMLIIVGGLLVALGVGAIVLLWMRRKENSDEDEDDDAPTASAAAAVRASRGPGQYHSGADPTRVANRAGMGADATSINQAALADAPTMMHNRPLVDDEFPDPYGAPLPQPSTYGAAGQPGYGYGGAPAQGEYGAGAPVAGTAPRRAALTATHRVPAYGNAPARERVPATATHRCRRGRIRRPGQRLRQRTGSEFGNAPGSGAGGYGNAPGAGAGAGGYGNAPGSGAGRATATHPAPAATAATGGEQPGAGYPPAPGGYPPAAPGGGRLRRAHRTLRRPQRRRQRVRPAGRPVRTGRRFLRGRRDRRHPRVRRGPAAVRRPGPGLRSGRRRLRHADRGRGLRPAGRRLRRRWPWLR